MGKLFPKDISEFIIRASTLSSLAGAQLMACALRSFLSYLYQTGRIAADLAPSVPSVANRRSAVLNQALEPEQIERLLRSCNQAAVLGRRDYAVLMLLAGQALANYLKKGRPRCACRQVFLRLRAPREGFHDSTAIRAIVDRALTRARLQPARRGSHLLRHSLGTNMLRNGSSLTQIGQILRHELTKTTEIYAKVDRASLQSLTLPWPGGKR